MREAGYVELDASVIQETVARALAEDVGSGDVTAESVLRAEDEMRAVIISRATGVVAGLPLAEAVFGQLSECVGVRSLVSDGQAVADGSRIAEVTGPARPIVTGERTALNFLQRLSGIATYTRRCVEAVAQYDATILDTRKTTPGLRHLEKYAVRIGGGTNHRVGLHDQVLIKDNHLRMLLSEAGDLPNAVRLAVQRAREGVRGRMRIEVEAESPAMVEAAIEAAADIIMLDNMSLDELAEAAQKVRRLRESQGSDTPVTEASGGVTLERLVDVARTGVDAISLGALTHSAPVLDLAMEVA